MVDKALMMASNSLMFFKTAEILNSVLKSASDANNAHLLGLYFIPHIVNKSFAVEMALKAILTREGIPYSTGKDGHRIDVLFNSLPEELRKTISNKLETILEGTDFDKQLVEIGGAFTDWRYFHEKSNSIKHDFFNIFAVNVCRLCYQMCNIQEVG